MSGVGAGPVVKKSSNVFRVKGGAQRPQSAPPQAVYRRRVYIACTQVLLLRMIEMNRALVPYLHTALDLTLDLEVLVELRKLCVLSRTNIPNNPVRLVRTQLLGCHPALVTVLEVDAVHYLVPVHLALLDATLIPLLMRVARIEEHLEASPLCKLAAPFELLHPAALPHSRRCRGARHRT